MVLGRKAPSEVYTPLKYATANSMRRRAASAAGPGVNWLEAFDGARVKVIATRLGPLSISLCPTVSLAGAPLDLPRMQLRLLQRLMEASCPVSVADLRKDAWRNEVVG